MFFFLLAEVCVADGRWGFVGWGKGYIRLAGWRLSVYPRLTLCPPSTHSAPSKAHLWVCVLPGGPACCLPWLAWVWFVVGEMRRAVTCTPVCPRPYRAQVYVPKNVPKDEHARVLISTALRENILFASLGQSEMLEMINAMAPVEFPSGAEVIKQGKGSPSVRVPSPVSGQPPCAPPSRRWSCACWRSPRHCFL